MYCLRCGREIPDGELFCKTCGRQPIERQQPPENKPPERVQESRQTTAAKRQEISNAAPKKRRNRLVIPFVLVCLLLVLACAFTVYAYRDMSLQKASYRVKEASLALRENELSDLEENYAAATDELIQTQAALAERDATVRSLEQEIREWESAASQNEYDSATAQKAIDKLTEENETLTDENEKLVQANETLTEEKADLTEKLAEKTAAAAAIQAELDTLTGKYSTAKAKADFMDSYVVFVNNNGTNYYHNYDCVNFTKSNFWAYSRKLAQNYGYTACPVCGG